MKFTFISIFFKALFLLAVLVSGGHAVAQSLMTATAKNGTVLSFVEPKEGDNDRELSVQAPTKKLKKYLVYMYVMDGHFKFAETVICARNCAHAKPETPGQPLKGGYQRVGNELRCVKNCRGLENGLTFRKSS